MTVVFASLISQIDKLGSIISSPFDPDILVIDGNQFLDHVVWPVSGTVAGIAANIIGMLPHKNVEQEMTHLCINTSLSTRNDVMGNNENNSQFPAALHLQHRPVCCQDCMVRHDEADITLSSYMLYAVREGTHRVRIFYVKTLCVPFLM